MIETILKPQHLKPPPEAQRFNYIIDIYSKWYQHYFYFRAKYHSPGPYAISPHFETKFAGLEYAGGNSFNLAYMRHTEQWFELYQGLSLEECLAAVRDEPFFFP